MGYAAGATIPGTTTLNAFVDAAFAGKSGALSGASATFTVLEPTVVAVKWPSVDAGHSLLYIRLTARPVLPSVITV